MESDSKIVKTWDAKGTWDEGRNLPILALRSQLWLVSF